MFPEIQGTGDWNTEMFRSCRNAGSATLNFGGSEVYEGRPVVLYKPEDSLFIYLQNNETVTVYELKKCKNPIVINEDGWNCVWFYFDEGYASIYFSKP